MDWKKKMEKGNLDRCAFQWSEARLAIAALALFLGGYPPVLKLVPMSSSTLMSVTSSLLNIAWIISGVAAAYLAYRWNESGKKLFGEEDPKDLTAFAVMIISGFNLGIAGVLGINIGMQMTPSALMTIIFIAAGVLYLTSLIRLWMRWKENGEVLFTQLENNTGEVEDEGAPTDDSVDTVETKE